MKANQNKGIRKENANHKAPGRGASRKQTNTPPIIGVVTPDPTWIKRITRVLIATVALLAVVTALLVMSIIPRYVQAEEFVTTEGKVAAAIQDMENPPPAPPPLPVLSPVVPDNIVVDVGSYPSPLNGSKTVGHISTGLIGVDIVFDTLDYEVVNTRLNTIVDCLEQGQNKYLPGMRKCVGTLKEEVNIYKYGVLERMKNYF